MQLGNLSGVVTLALTLPLLTFGCKEDPASPSDEGNGAFRVEITDAPSDDANVKGVFVTIADIRVAGESLEAYTATTVEISALTNGATELLYAGELAAKSYNKIELVLEDGLTAVAGGPGCYYVNEDNQKVALEVADEGVITLTDSGFEMVQSGSVNAVVDFDLRKALVRTGDETKPYAFAATNRLNNSLRVVQKDRTGTLSGTVSRDSQAEGEVVVYAYQKGTFTASEAEGDSDDELFLNAVSSTKLNTNNEYTLAYLEAGSYELVAVSYEDTDEDGRLEMRGQFKISAIGELDLGLLQVTANSTTTADFKVSFLPG
ncbi:uncharacterized protein DUF4382 [Neolewinella xylanilytica]|uniref:Uncharacterized protein DUF4382 n=1 Tax=Neolewinella xylanilytica TaxID=1514080 RepID=A0A2S6I4X5_9BACT|nr:DUF4382 domain-containing protein [Neolewinella xylanilytica]PPK86224.1 uncharacterized protein DUF4382 [Neolewinella xylanilytica]